MLRVLAILAVVGVLVSSTVAPADAGEIRIEILGLDAAYDGLDLYDAGSPFGGFQNPAQADPLTSLRFFDDGVLVGSLASGIHADFAIVDISGLPVGGGVAHSPFGGFFDLLTSGGGWGLGLDLDAFDLRLVGSTLTGGGTAQAIAGQALPFGLVIEAPVHVSFVLSLANVTDDGVAVTGFTGTGVGTIPEPATVLLLSGGLAALGFRRRSRRQRAQ